jgi:hypothetical protein
MDRKSQINVIAGMRRRGAPMAELEEAQVNVI